MDNQFPPTNPTPPVITAPKPVKPPKRGRGWMILSILLFVVLMFSLLGNATHFLESVLGANVSTDHLPGPKLEEVTLEDNDSKDKIAVINVEGVIMSGSSENGYTLVDLIKEQFKRADDDEHVKAVVLKVNSPGGEVLASDDIYKIIAKFQKDSKKPVVCSMGSLAASGGYYVSAPCRWIVANELTITGSIGVIMHGFNYRGLMDKIGLRPDVYKSGKFKDMLSPDRADADIPPEERAMVQDLIDQTYGKFKSVVAEGRKLAHEKNKKEGMSLATDWEKFADGRVLSGKQALELGLVDELGDFDTAVDKAMDLVGITEKESANLIEYQPRHDLSELLRMFGKTDARALKVDIGLDFPKLHAGYLYFLSPTFIH